jgi:uncharacterized membrane protein
VQEDIQVKKSLSIMMSLVLMLLFMASSAYSWGKFKTVSPEDGILKIRVEDVNDGKAHYFEVKADDGTKVEFFLLMSMDGVIRAAIDSCDVCYRSGKGYVQEGDFMVCTNCGRRFASDRINVVKGGCNPAPLNRKIVDANLVISMADINQNSWYCKYK